MKPPAPTPPPSGPQSTESNQGPESGPQGVVLGVFAKHWTPGLSKTRLASAIGPERASEAARLFLLTTLNRLSTIEATHLLAFAPDEQRKAFEEMTAKCSAAWRLAPQPEGSLGERMRWFFDEAFAQGARAAVLLGSDSPDFPIDAVRQAVAWLEEPVEGRRLVLGPSTDGGYWLIAARGAAPPVLEGMPWSSSDLIEKTLARLDSIGWARGSEYELIDTWNDVDTAEDLTALKERLPSTEEFAELRIFLGT